MRLTEEQYQALLKRGTVQEVRSHQGESRPQESCITRENAPAPPDESERRFMDRICSLARTQGWKGYHTYDSRRSEPGFPDLILTDGVALLAVEVKTNTGKLTPAQQIWLSLLEHAGVEVHIWRPKDWSIIEARLTRKVNDGTI